MESEVEDKRDLAWRVKASSIYLLGEESKVCLTTFDRYLGDRHICEAYHST